MSKFTPGPWNFNGSGVYGADGTTIADMETYYPAPLDPNNGPLIAAAPELLEALEESTKQLKWFLELSEKEGWVGFDEPASSIEQSEAAIAKARGE
jgi:hypothetical protein